MVKYQIPCYRTPSPPPLNESLALIKCGFQLTCMKRLKLGQCLDIDYGGPITDIGGHSQKFDDITLPSSHFTERSVFYRLVLYRQVCKIVNL